MANALDNVTIDETSFTWLDLLGIDRWKEFVVIAVLTVVGTPTYLGRNRVVGKQVFFQISAVATTSIASTAGVSYFALPITPAKGLAGSATMSNATTHIAVGTCEVSVADGRVYLPTLGATGDLVTVAGWYEKG